MCYTKDMAKNAYTKVNVDGFTLDARTAELWKQIQVIYPLMGGTGKPYIVQGSYNDSVGQSAGTHDGSGAIDVSLTMKSDKNWKALERAGRWVMQAGWHREPLYRNGKLVWSDHYHGITLGDEKVAPVAARQQQDYLANPPRNGLADHSVDESWRPDKLFTPLYPILTVDYKNMVREAKKTKGHLPFPGIKRIQAALNVKLGLKLKIDGKFGPLTKSAYKTWEKKVGVKGAALDGVPGPRNLILLGAGRFHVRNLP